MKYYQKLHDFEEQELKLLMQKLEGASIYSNGKDVNVNFKDKEIVLLTSIFKEILDEIH